jgi:hypothetical protein
MEADNGWQLAARLHRRLGQIDTRRAHRRALDRSQTDEYIRSKTRSGANQILHG